MCQKKSEKIKFVTLFGQYLPKYIYIFIFFKRRKKSSPYKLVSLDDLGQISEFLTKNKICF